MLLDNAMYIVALAWVYVVLMMAITEHSVIAGIMTFLLYGVLPLAVILYIAGSPQRKRDRRKSEEALAATLRNERDAQEKEKTSE